MAKNKSPKPQQNLPLTKDQGKFLNLIETSQDNFFVNGPPGTGKSVLTRALRAGRKPWIVAAPTGLAAINAEGFTLNKTFSIPVSKGIIHPSFSNFPTDRRTVGFLRYNLKYLLIDEISMVRADVLDYLDRLLQDIKNRYSVPFGGVQVVVVGDFYQLPPVVKEGEGKALREAGWETPFCFSSKVFDTFTILTLSENLRQKGDLKFIKILQAAREGKLTPKMMVDINDRIEDCPNDLRIRICATNAQTDLINQDKLKRIKKDSYRFKAEVNGQWDTVPVDEIIDLKVGAQVMVRMNAADIPPDSEGPFESDVVNGTIGKVIDIKGCKKVIPLKPGENIFSRKLKEMEEDKEEVKQPYIVIETDKGERTIYIKTWTLKVKKEISPGEWEEITVASFTQIPVTLAWAISMHKSQGQTFEKVHIDPSAIFAKGQGYVALSRCKTLEGITLESRFNLHKHFQIDERVTNFFKQREQAQKNKSKKEKAKIHTSQERNTKRHL